MTEADRKAYNVLNALLWLIKHPEVQVRQRPDGKYHAVVLAGTDPDPHISGSTLPERPITPGMAGYSEAAAAAMEARREVR